MYFLSALACYGALLLAGSSVEVCVVSTAVIFIGGVYCASRILLRYPEERLNPFLLLSFLYSLQFCLAILLSWNNKILTWDHLLHYYEDITLANILRAMLLAYVFSLCCASTAYVFSRSSLWRTVKMQLYLSLTKDRYWLSVIAIVITSVQLMLIITGKVTLQGESMINKDLDDLKVYPLVAIIAPFACVAVFNASYLFNVKKDWRWLLVLTVQLVWFFLWGRRNIIYFGVLTMFGMFYAQEVKFLPLNVRRAKLLLKGLSFAVIILLAARTFHHLRIVGGVGILQQVSFENAKKLAEKYAQSNSSELGYLSEFNLEFRNLSTTAAIAYYDKIMRNGEYRLGYGAEIVNSVLRATPSGYFVNKASIPVMEGMASILTYGVIDPDDDMGDSLLFEGLMDFGYWGIILYPLILGFLILSFLFCITLLHNRILVLVVVITTVFAIMTMLEGGVNVLLMAFRTDLVVVATIFLLKGIRMALRTKQSNELQYRTVRERD